MTVPQGSLPIFAVDTEEEAHRLLVLACPTTPSGEFVAEELVREQTLENLFAFGNRLASVYEDHRDWITEPKEES